DLGLGAVQVLGRAFAEDAAGEADDAAQGVLYGEDDALPEPVVAPPPLVLDDQAERDQVVLPRALGEHVPQERVPGVRGVADLEGLDGLVRQAPASEVLAGRRSQLGPEE